MSGGGPDSPAPSEVSLPFWNLFGASIAAAPMSVNRSGTQSEDPRHERRGSSARFRGRHTGLVEFIQLGCVLSRYLRGLIIGDALKDLLHYLLGPGEGGLGVGIVRRPLEVVDPNVGAELNA